jgi:hypothetical protein
VRRSIPEDYLAALPEVGITHFNVTSLAQARRVRRLVPNASISLSLSEAASETIARAYHEFGIRTFRIQGEDQLAAIMSALESPQDLEIIVHLPPSPRRMRSNHRPPHDLAAFLFQARSAADVLGLGIDAGVRPMRPRDYRAMIDDLRNAIVEAAVTVDIIEICGGTPAASEGEAKAEPQATFQAIAERFEALPISYSAELWFQPSEAFFDQRILEGWSERYPSDTKPQRKKQTFFISYSAREEWLAREVVKVIEAKGHSAIVQFRDFAQASFVRSMREGIADSDRFVALQSKAYWSSDHCQAEWDAAYALDPGGKKRFIVPFLVEPVGLPPIASELVYKSLVGLNLSQRKRAIADWIDYVPVRRSRAQLRKALAKQASPEVNLRDRRLDAGPNLTFDRALVDEDLVELPANLRAIIDTLIESLPANAPPIVRNCLKGYRQHLIERGTQPIVGTLVPFAEAVDAQVEADKGLWDRGLEKLLEHFSRRHQLLITHFPLNPERELLLRETPIDEFSASGEKIIDPVAEFGEAIVRLRELGLTTENFDDAEAAHQQFSRDVASLPMSGDLAGDRVSPKRRYVLGTIGFYERVLASLGGLASIGSLARVPVAQTAISAAAMAIRRAIKAFMEFIL